MAHFPNIKIIISGKFFLHMIMIDQNAVKLNLCTLQEMISFKNVAMQNCDARTEFV